MAVEVHLGECGFVGYMPYGVTADTVVVVVVVVVGSQKMIGSFVKN